MLQLIDRGIIEPHALPYPGALDAGERPLVNTLSRYVREDEGPHAQVLAEAIDSILLLLAPMAPHLPAELYERRTGRHVHEEPWPTFDPQLVTAATETMVIQVKGKVRDRVEVDPQISEEEAIALALASEKVIDELAGASPTRVIARPPKLVNIVP